MVRSTSEVPRCGDYQRKALTQTVVTLTEGLKEEAGVRTELERELGDLRTTTAVNGTRLILATASEGDLVCALGTLPRRGTPCCPRRASIEGE